MCYVICTSSLAGASSGIGAAAAEEFAKYGAYLSLTGRNEERLKEVATRCQHRGVSPEKVIYVPIGEGFLTIRITKRTAPKAL